jgi:signal-transduction protein with cAMP-binding, CBS, and nucleotidyltransferase domain
MSVGKICIRRVVIASHGESLREAAGRMVAEDVGALVVLDAEKRPIGIVTDRDLVARCIAEGRDPARSTVGDVMSKPAARVHEGTAIEDALVEMMRARARRLPVVDDAGRLVGILALDDVLELLAEETATIGRLLARRGAPAGGR